MPINYQLTFNTPLLNLLDKGFVGGPDKLSSAFTDYYVKTLLTGLPGGSPSTLPPTLPAPGLNPTAPPPYPIIAVPINNYEVRKRRMQKILKVYFQAREIFIQNGSIRAIITNIRRLTKLVPALRKELAKLQKEIRNIAEEIERLPRLVEDLKIVIEDIFLEEVNQLTRLLDGLDNFKIQLTPEETELFKFIQSFKNQELSFNGLLDRINQFSYYLTRLEDFLENIPTDEPNTEQQTDQEVGDELASVKRYALQQTLESFRSLFNLVNCVANPMEYIAYFRDVATFDRKYVRVVALLEDYRILYTILKPQLKKLQIKVENKTQELKKIVNEKIAEQVNLLKKKQVEKAAKRDGEAKQAQRVKRLKQIRDKKKKILDRVRLYNKRLKDIRKILLLIRNIEERGIKIKNEVEYQLEEGLQRYLEGSLDVNTDTSQLINGINGHLLVAGSDKVIDNVDTDLLAILDVIGIRPKQLRDVIINKLQLKSIKTPYPLYQYFLTEGSQYVGLYNDVTILRKEIREVYFRTKALLNGKDVDPRDFPISPLVTKVSLKLLLNGVYEDIEKEISTIKKDVNTLAGEITTKVEDLTNKAKKDIEVLLLQLVPVSSKNKERKNKAQLLEYKRRRVRDRVKQAKALVKGTQLMFKSFNAIRTLVITNIVTNKKYSYRDNARAIDQLIDSFFDYKIFSLGYPGGQWYTDPQNQRGQSQRSQSYVTSETQQLINQRDTLKADIRGLLTYLELFIDLIIEVAAEIKKSENTGISLTQALGERLEAKWKTSDAIAPYRSFYVELQKFINSLQNTGGSKKVYNTLSQALNFMNTIEGLSTKSRILESTQLQTTLTQLENEYIGNIKSRYNSFANSELAQLAKQQQLTGDPESSRSKYYAKVQSFIPQKPFEESFIMLPIYAMVYIVRELGKVLDDLYKKYIQPELKGVIDQFDKWQKSYKEEIQNLSRRLTRFDIAYLLPRVLNLATRAFWIGFSWNAPDGTVIRCLQIPQITPLRDVVTRKVIIDDDGVSGWVQAAAWALFPYQAANMVGTLQPPPNTGIPLLVFRGYK